MKNLLISLQLIRLHSSNTDELNSARSTSTVREKKGGNSSHMWSFMNLDQLIKGFRCTSPITILLGIPRKKKKDFTQCQTFSVSALG
jgi:hypothetical protein